MLSFFRKQSTSSLSDRTRVRPEFEDLEGRELMTAGVSLTGGVLKVEASNNGDTVKFEKLDNGTPNNPLDDKIRITWTHGNVTEIQTYSMYGLVGGQLKQVIKSVEFAGGTGNDKVWNNTALSSVMRGGAGDDEMHGGSGHDFMEGGAGSDTLYGNDGDDELWAYKENSAAKDSAVNILYGGKGNDWLFGAEGALNFLYGGDDDDTLWGGHDGATNFLYGEYGNDTYYAGDYAAMNTVIDHHGSELVWCGDHSFNIVDVTDGGVGINTDDIVIMGVGSYDSVSYDPQIDNGYWVAGDHVFHSWIEYENWKNGW